MDARIKKQTKETVIPPYNQENLERTISEAKKIQMHPERYLINEYQFFVDQLRFIQKKTWLLKIFCTAAFFILIKFSGKETIDGWVWSIVAIMGPLFCLINANELFSVCQQGIAELQMTTHFTSSKIMIARLIAFGMFDILFLGAASVHVSHAYDSRCSLQSNVLWLYGNNEPFARGRSSFLLCWIWSGLNRGDSHEQNIRLKSFFRRAAYHLGFIGSCYGRRCPGRDEGILEKGGKNQP